MANTSLTTNIIARTVCSKISDLWLDTVDDGPMTHFFDLDLTVEQMMLPIRDLHALIEPKIVDLVKRCKETNGRFRRIILPQGTADVVMFGCICVGVVSMPSASDLGTAFRVGVCYR